mmetsp:Transcript_6950/g.16737  ORF Transcript_6950/g.16737 Transcript_6950/m.16737 type:complete len:615 (-) Transcript_6950:26-1870(-)
MVFLFLAWNFKHYNPQTTTELWDVPFMAKNGKLSCVPTLRTNLHKCEQSRKAAAKYSRINFSEVYSSELFHETCSSVSVKNVFGLQSQGRPSGRKVGLSMTNRLRMGKRVENTSADGLRYDVLPADFLLVDGTNLYFKARGTPGAGVNSEKLRAWLYYLTAIVRPKKTVVVFDSKDSTHGGRRRAAVPGYKSSQRVRGASKRESHHQARSRIKGVPLAVLRAVAAADAVPIVAPQGHEADDVLAGIATALRGVAGARTAVASGDGDMRSLIGPTTSWLEVMDRVTPSNPFAVLVHTEEGFRRLHGFPPERYPHYLALVGKPAAGVRSTGIGGKAAQRLIARFGSIDGILEAGRRGQLSGWGPRIREAFAPSPVPVSTKVNTEHVARQNLLAVAPHADPQLVEDLLNSAGLSTSEMAKYFSHNATECPETAGHGLGVASGDRGAGPELFPILVSHLYPPNVAHVQACKHVIDDVAEVLSAMGVSATKCHVTEGATPGWLVDLMIAPGWSSVTAEPSNKSNHGLSEQPTCMGQSQTPDRMQAIRFIARDELCKGCALTSEHIPDCNLSPTALLYLRCLRRNRNWDLRTIACWHWEQLGSQRQKEAFVLKHCFPCNT